MLLDDAAFGVGVVAGLEPASDEPFGPEPESEPEPDSEEDPEPESDEPPDEPDAGASDDDVVERLSLR